MKRSLMAAAAAATLGLAAVAAPHQAQAHDGGRVAAGVLGGLAAGAIIGGAVSGGYGPYYGYGPGYGYYAAPAYGGPCYWQRERFWDGYGWRIRRTRVCY